MLGKNILLSSCNRDVQRENINAYFNCGMSYARAAESLGKTPKAVRTTVKRATARALKAGAIQQISNINDKCAETDNFDVKAKIDSLSGDYQDFVSQDAFNIIITSAQNSTPSHSGFMANLNTLAKEHNAKRLVIPFRYKNPTSMHVDSGKDYWAEDLLPYMCEDDFDLNENLCVLGKLKTQPTAVRPLSGLESVSGSKSAIIGHTKLELKSVATPGNRLPKTMVTTGCCTVANYTDSKAGYKGEKHHTLSALLVMVDGNKFFLRQIIAENNGNFIDMLTEYKDGEAAPAEQALVLSTGDLHGVNHDPLAVAATFTNKDSMLNYFKPKYVTIDDSLDFERSHHIKKDPVAMAILINRGHTVKKELRETFALIDSFHSKYSKVVIKRSNHDEHFERWVKETDPRNDPINYKLWCEAYPLMIKEKDIYKHFAEKWMDTAGNTIFLDRDESFVVGGINHDGHGDLGANGSRGGLQGFTKLGSPGQWGHSHTCGIMDDQYQNGTLSKLKLNYNRGPSSWTHCNTIQYANSKRSLLFIIDGKWRV